MAVTKHARDAVVPEPKYTDDVDVSMPPAVDKTTQVSAIVTLTIAVPVRGHWGPDTPCGKVHEEAIVEAKRRLDASLAKSYGDTVGTHLPSDTEILSVKVEKVLM